MPWQVTVVVHQKYIVDIEDDEADDKETAISKAIDLTDEWPVSDAYVYSADATRSKNRSL